MAGYSGWAFDETFSASGDLSGYQYRFVALSTGGDRSVILATGASNPLPIGVLQNAPESGQAAAVRILGITQVYASAASAITPGMHLTATTTGYAVKATGSPAAAIALESLSSGSALISALLIPAATRFA
jgi:hypothetical protein